MILKSTLLVIDQETQNKHTNKLNVLLCSKQANHKETIIHTIQNQYYLHKR